MVYCIFYDISSPKRRYRVVKALDRISTWKQRSTYCSDFKLEEVQKVIEEKILPIIDEETDIVSMYPISKINADNALLIGSPSLRDCLNYYLL